MDRFDNIFLLASIHLMRNGKRQGLLRGLFRFRKVTAFVTQGFETFLQVERNRIIDFAPNSLFI